MINIGDRIHYFPRGITEINPEYIAQKDKYSNLAIENNLLLIYPFAMFYYVSPKFQILAEAIEKGLKLAYSDGSFHTFFENHPDIKAIYSKLRLKERRKIFIDNPYLSEKARNIPAQYWIKEDRVFGNFFNLNSNFISLLSFD